MNITKIGFYTNNIQNRNIQSAKNLKQNYSTNAIQANTMPTIAPNYMANISFRGRLDWNEIAKYTQDMGKRIYSKRHVTNLSQVHESACGITAGRGLPDEWMKRIKDPSKFDKDNFITEFGELFEQERTFADADKLEAGLAQLFQKYGIIDKQTPFSVKYIGHGFQAWAYRIGIGEDKNTGVVTKLFKRNNNFLQNHGNHTEQNLAEYVKDCAGDSTEFVKYFYGDTKHGLMTVEYLPDTIEKPLHKTDLSDFGIGYGDDFPKNRKNGWICDYGGIETISNLIGNKAAQKVHSAIKYAKTPEEKIDLFNKIIAQNDGSDEFKDKAIGLVHSIKHLPEEIQPKLYQQCYDLGSHRVNISLIQCIKYFSQYNELSPLIEKLVTNVDDIKAQENIAKEIRHIPTKLRHQFFEEYTNTKHSATIKYLARNINQYYMNMPNRVNIYKAFSENADPYASVALINSMKFMGSSRYGEYFEKFFSKNDDMVNTSLARSIDLLNDDKKLQQQWIDKLLSCDSVQVNTGLSEVIPYINEELRGELFEKLVLSKDKVVKEFLAENITSLPKHLQTEENVTKLLENADNMVRGSLANTISKMPDSRQKSAWTKLVLDGADDFIKTMVLDEK